MCQKRDFNHVYQPKTRKVIGPIDIFDWTKFIEKIVKKKLGSPPVIIDVEDAQLIQGNLDQEFDNIVIIVLENKNHNNNNNNNNNKINNLKKEVNFTVTLSCMLVLHYIFEFLRWE